MKHVLAIIALFLCGATAHAQTTPTVVYSCQNTATSVPGTNAKDYVTCGNSSWSWQPAPRRDADAPLVAACSSACGWGTSATLVWRRPSQVLATESIAVCQRSPSPAAGTRGSCSPERFLPRDQVLIAPPSNPPVNCVLGDFALKTTGAWGQCVSPGERSRTDIWERTVATPASNGGAACPSPLPTEPRVATEACVIPVVGLSTTKDTIYTGESVPLTWHSAGVTACSASWSPGSGIPLQQPTPVLVGPFNFPTTVTFSIACTGPNQPAQNETRVTVKTRTPSAWVHLDDLLAKRVKWKLVEAQGTGYDLIATYFTASGQETWATTWREVMTRMAMEYYGIPYDEAAAAAQCEATCALIDPNSPLGLEMAALRESVTPAERAAMGIVE